MSRVLNRTFGSGAMLPQTRMKMAAIGKAPAFYGRPGSWTRVTGRGTHGKVRR